MARAASSSRRTRGARSEGGGPGGLGGAISRLFERAAFMRTTTFRLALWYGLVFVAFVFIFLIYIYASTVYFLRTQADERIDAEMASLAAAYNTGGVERLNQAVIERASAPGSQFFYLLQDAEGRKISGDLSALPQGAPNDPLAPIFFEYDVRRFNGDLEARKAEGRVANLGTDGVFLVAFDIGQRDAIVRLLTFAVYTAGLIGILLALAGGIVTSRSAARRADSLANTAEQVMRGDLSTRAPVRGSNDEFDRLAERMNQMLERIQRLMASERHSSDAIAHDLRSPLSRLRNRIESALKAPLTLEEAEETLGETLEDIDQMLGTFNAILRLARLDAGAEGKFVKTDLSAVAEEISDLFEPACEDADLSFHPKIEGGLMVLGDRNLLSQTLANLLDNAVKYTPAGGGITLIAAKSRDSTIECSVTDTGPGVPAKDRKEVVRRFSRLDAARSQAGSGLGLSLVDAVAELHGGEFSLHDGGGPPERPGLKAVLRLPRAQ